MKAFKVMLFFIGTVAAVSLAVATSPQESTSTPAPIPDKPLPFEVLAAKCAPDIHPATLKSVITTESSWNPFAIGVVGGRLEHQPTTLAEAIATAYALEDKGMNFSMGLGQVNRYNIPKYGETYETIFEPCRNLKAGSAILTDCYVRAKAKMGNEQKALRAAFSCYYSGNFTRGFQPDRPGEPSYVEKVLANADKPAKPVPVVPAIDQRSSSKAVAVQADRARSITKRSRIEEPSQWVIFTGTAQKQESASPAQTDEDAGEPPAKAELMDGTVLAKTKPAAQPVRATQNTVQQDAPFVQFVN